MKEEIIERAVALGFATVGFCRAVRPTGHIRLEQWLVAGFHGSMSYMERHKHFRSDPSQLLPGAKSIVAVTLNYYQEASAEAGRPRIARYALGRDYHKVMRGKLRSLSRYVESLAPEVSCRACVDSAPILEREFAHMAGLGWFGKNTMLIDTRRGSWFFIGLLLTTLEIEPDQPTIGGCGTCKACVDACPTSAIVSMDGRWQVDSRKCISYLTIEHKGPFTSEQREKVGDWTFGCDVCQEVCPFNAPRPHHPERAVRSETADFLRKREWPRLTHLAQVSREEWDELTAGSAVRRAGHEGLRRNALANLENG